MGILIEGVENQMNYDIPVSLRFEPKNDTVTLSREDIESKIDKGIEIPTLGIKISKSMRKMNKEKKARESRTNRYKMIATITGIVLLTLFVIYMITSYKKTNPLLDLLS
jgi:hypothetical protein